MQLKRTAVIVCASEPHALAECSRRARASKPIHSAVTAKRVGGMRELTAILARVLRPRRESFPNGKLW